MILNKFALIKILKNLSVETKSRLNISTGHWKMSGKKRVVYDKSGFTTDAVVQREVKTF